MRILALALALSIAPAVASAQPQSTAPAPEVVYELPFTNPPADAPAVSSWESIQVEGIVHAIKVPESLLKNEPILSWLVPNKICNGTAYKCDFLVHSQLLLKRADETPAMRVMRVAFRGSSGTAVELFLSARSDALADHRYWKHTQGAWSVVTDEEERRAIYDMASDLLSVLDKLLEMEEARGTSAR